MAADTPDVRHTLDMLIEQVDGSADWRAMKADEYPDDTRNQDSADALSLLAKQLASVPLNHPAVVALANLWQGASEDETPALVEAESMYIGRYGFDGPEECGGEAFLDGLRRELESELEEAREDER